MQIFEPEGSYPLSPIADKKKKLLLHSKFTWKTVGTVVGSNSSHRFGSIGTQTRPEQRRITK